MKNAALKADPPPPMESMVNMTVRVPDRHGTRASAQGIAMPRPACTAPPCATALPPLPRRVTITPAPAFDYFALACVMAYGRLPGPVVRIADEEDAS